VPESTAGLIRSFVRSLRWQVPTALVIGLGLWALNVYDARDNVAIVEAILASLGFVVVLGPLAWLRWTHFGRYDKPFWAFFGLAIAWALVSGAIVLGLVGLRGAD
jgi:hypothetical protein